MRDAPDAAVLVVATRVAEIDLAVLNDRVRPVGDVDRTVGTDLHVDGTKRDVLGADEVRHLARDVGGILVVDGEAHDTMRAEIARHGVALPVVREVRAADVFEARELRIRRRPLIESSPLSRTSAPGARIVPIVFDSSLPFNAIIP